MSEVQSNNSTYPEIKLLALSNQNQEGNIAQHFIEFKNNDGEKVQRLIPSFTITNITKIKEFLINHGYPVETDTSHWKKVQGILSDQTSDRVILSKQPGFVGSEYLCASGEVIGNSAKYGPLFYPSVSLHMPIEATQGSLEDWQINVAAKATHSSRLMLALCSVFSGFIIRLSDVESGGFHFFGDSSIGKSGCLNFAASVCGNSDFVESWSSAYSGESDH